LGKKWQIPAKTPPRPGHLQSAGVSTQSAGISHRLKTARKWWVLGEGRILIPELISIVCFGRRKRNQLFITAQTSLYAVYVNAQGACGRAREFRPKEACGQKNRKNRVLHSGRGSGIMSGKPHYCLMQTALTTLSSKRTN
jgi:hypothetical protein